jgi:hypothetical protein
MHDLMVGIYHDIGSDDCYQPTFNLLFIHARRLKSQSINLADPEPIGLRRQLAQVTQRQDIVAGEREVAAGHTG